MKSRRQTRVVALLLAAAALAGCAGERWLAPAPTIYTLGTEAPFQNLSPSLRSAEVDVLFVTDRKPERDQEGHLAYGFGRSASVAYGSAVVRLGSDLSWEAIRAATVSEQSPRSTELALVSVREDRRGIPTPLPWTLVDGRPVTEPAAARRSAADAAAFCAEIGRRLAMTPRKEAFVFVHGVGNGFADTVLTVAEVWHYLGRVECRLPSAGRQDTAAGFADIPTIGNRVSLPTNT